MSPLQERVCGVLWWVSVCFLLLMAGIMAGHHGWVAAKAYDVVIAFSSQLLHGGDNIDVEKRVPPATMQLDPGRISPGVTLLTTLDNRVVALDAAGGELYRWQLPFQAVWPHYFPDELGKSFVHFASAHLLPDASLIGVYHDARQLQNYGMGMVKIDKQSAVLWSYKGRVHDHFDVSGDRIYALEHQSVSSEQAQKLALLSPPQLADTIVVLSAGTGKILDMIDLLDSFTATPYEHMLYSHNSGKKKFITATSVEVLPSALSMAFPQFEEGFLLVSVKSLNCIAVIDPLIGKVVWAARGAFTKQDKAIFGADGNIWVYDSQGYYAGKRNNTLPRILRVNPLTQGLAGSYVPSLPPKLFGVDKSNNSMDKGDIRQLDNGNVLIAMGAYGTVLEVTPAFDVVWKHYRDQPVFEAHRIDGMAWGEVYATH